MLNEVQQNSISKQFAYGLVTHMQTNIAKECNESWSEGKQREFSILIGLEKIMKSEASYAASHVFTSLRDKGSAILTTEITLNQSFSVEEDGIDIIKMGNNLNVSVVEDRYCLNIRKGSVNLLYKKVTTLDFRAMGASLIQEVDRNVFIIANRNRVDPDIAPLAYALAYAPPVVLNFSAFGGSR